MTSSALRCPDHTGCENQSGNEPNFVHLNLRTKFPGLTYTGTWQASMARDPVE